MKLTDLSLIYIAVLLPIIIVVYINVSFTIKAQEQEIYYKNLIDIAAADASSQMKEVENEDTSIDYGYSGNLNSKVSVNAKTAVNTFLDNMYNNFGIKGNEAAERYLQLFVPAIAIIDYDGVIISSVEEYKNQNDEIVVEHTLKPKQHYSYTYTIVLEGSSYKIVDGYSTNSNAHSYHHVEFTMDDYIIHRGSTKSTVYETKSFYISDKNENNNSDLAPSSILDDVVKHLETIRKDIIVNTVVKEVTYAVNKNNTYARNAGITYNFAFPTTSTEDMYGAIENVGFLAFVQGINVGNKYLNAKAYSLTSVELATRYYFTIPNSKPNTSKYQYNLYHRDVHCPEYVASYNDNIDKVTPRYVLTKQEATSTTVKVKLLNGPERLYQGFYPCPICSP